MRVLLSVVMAMVLAATPSVVFAGPITIFGDGYGPGWSKGDKSVYIDTDNTYGGSAASLGRVGGVTVGVTQANGLDISGTPLLRAYVNFLVSDATPGHSLTNVRVLTTDGTLFEFDDRSVGWVCSLDGSKYKDAAEIVFDTDPATWQLFEIDLSQTDYFGWPYQSKLLGDAPITSIEFNSYGNTTGAINMLADNIQLVPEPATMSLLALGGLALIRRRQA